MNYAKGLSIWGVKEDQISPEHDLMQVLKKQEDYFDVYRNTFRRKNNFKEKNSQKFEKSILNEKRFNSFFVGDDNKSETLELLASTKTNG